jgi:hypothetical protein
LCRNSSIEHFVLFSICLIVSFDNWIFVGWIFISSPYSTVTDLAKFLGWSTSFPKNSAM